MTHHVNCNGRYGQKRHKQAEGPIASYCVYAKARERCRQPFSIRYVLASVEEDYILPQRAYSVRAVACSAISTSSILGESKSTIIRRFTRINRRSNSPLFGGSRYKIAVRKARRRERKYTDPVRQYRGKSHGIDDAEDKVPQGEVAIDEEQNYGPGSLSTPKEVHLFSKRDYIFIGDQNWIGRWRVK